MTNKIKPSDKLMTKKNVILSASLIAILVGASVWYFAKSTSTVQNESRTFVPSSPTTNAAPTQPAESETVGSDSPDEKAIAELHGKDFTLSVTENGNPLYKNLSAELANGKSIDDLVRVDGSRGKLANELFSIGDTFELKQLLPNTVRTQLVAKGRTVLTDGYGILGNYAIYRVDDSSITELLNLVTERDFSGLEGQPAQKLTATVVEKLVDGQSSIIYRYAAGNSQYQTIVFKWNGNAFVDMSGKYKNLDEKYRP